MQRHFTNIVSPFIMLDIVCQLNCAEFTAGLFVVDDVDRDAIFLPRTDVRLINK